MGFDYDNPIVQAALKAYKNLDDEGKRAFFWATQNPVKSGLDEMRFDNLPAAPEPDASSTILATSQGIEAFIELLGNLKGRSVMTGIPELDEAVAGLERQTLTILAARPSMGKTTLAWQIARNVAASGLKVLFLSLEVSTASLWAKAVCGAAGLRWRNIRLKANTEGVSEDVISYLAHHAQELRTNYRENLLVDEGTHTTASINAAVQVHRPDLIVIDHLRYIKDKHESETKRLGIVTERLKEIAKFYNMPVLCAAQLSRGVENREDKRPTLADLRDSGEIEENADNVWMLYRDDYYKQSGGVKMSETEVLIRKARDDVGRQMVKLQFDMEHQWFKSVSGMKP